MTETGQSCQEEKWLLAFWFFCLKDSLGVVFARREEVFLPSLRPPRVLHYHLCGACVLPRNARP
jgi:hypothetical protein